MPKVKSPGKNSSMVWPNYDKKAIEEAQNYAKQTGKQMEIEGYRGGGLIPKYQRGGRVPMGRGMRPGMGRGMNPGMLEALVQGLKKRFKKGGKVK